MPPLSPERYRFVAGLREEKGRLIAIKHPEIVDMIKSGMKLLEIARELDIAKTYNLKDALLHTAMKEAVRTLIPDKDERDRLYSAVRNAGSSKSGIVSRDTGTGLFGLSPEQKQQSARTMRRNTGVGWFDSNERYRDMTPGAYLLFLVRQRDFNHQAGKYKDTPDYKKICAEINLRFEHQRTVTAVRAFFNNRNIRGPHSSDVQESPITDSDPEIV